MDNQKAPAPARRTRKILLSLALVAGALSLAGVGAYSTFTSTANGGPQSISSGTVTLNIGAPGTAANRLTVGASNVAPGDTIQRAFDLTNAGNIDFSGVTVTSTASTSSVLDTDAVNGLQMKIDKCAVAWTETPIAGGGFSYTCGGVTTSVVASSAVIGANRVMNNLGILTAPSGPDHLLLTLTLPSSADNTFQGKTSTINYSFTATQRNGTAK